MRTSQSVDTSGEAETSTVKKKENTILCIYRIITLFKVT